MGNKIVYYVASSIDGYIAGENEDISGFLQEGDGVQQYLEDLGTFETVMMGRKTYEFGYKFGLKPGSAPYPHMNHFIFSNHLILKNAAQNVAVKPIRLEEIDQIKETATTDVYLCGGGIFAGWLLDNKRIDVLKLKMNPFVLGKGVKIFGDSKAEVQLHLFDSKSYEDGLLINSYNIKYKS